MSDGTLKHTSTYPVADCAPIMAYLAVNYQSYDLTDNIKNEIDNIVACLYTFDYKIDDYTFQEEHGSHTITYTGKKITFIVKYHNPENYFNSIIPDEKRLIMQVFFNTGIVLISDYIISFGTTIGTNMSGNSMVIRLKLHIIVPHINIAMNLKQF